MIDTHCHLDSPRFDEDRDQVLQRAWDTGLTAVVVPAVGPEGWDGLLELARREKGVHVALGIHPQLLPELPPKQDDEHLARLDELLKVRVARAVGECGLDGASAALAPLERQIQVLRGHFELARRHELPVLLHCLRMHPALVELLRDEPLPEAGVVLHSYSGGADLAQYYARKGCWFSFAGPVAFQDARKPIAALRAIPKDRLMVETDAPDQAPHPFRGQRSEPAYLRHIVAAVARALEMSEQEAAELTAANALRFFRMH